VQNGLKIEKGSNTYDEVSFTMATTGTSATVGSWNSGYGGYQIGTSKNKPGTITFTFDDPWGGNGKYATYTKITSVTFEGNAGQNGGSGISATIGGSAATVSPTTIARNTSGPTTNVTITPGSTNTGAVVISVNSSGAAFYFKSITITASGDTGSGTPVEGVSISGPSSISMVQYETLQLEAIVNPTDATNKAVSWSSSDDSKVSVDANGLLTANASTTSPVNIIVETQDGGFQDTISVSVTPALYSMVEYNITSKNTLTTGGNAPLSSSAKIVETYTTSKQMTAGNSQTLTLSGFNRVKISQITLSAKSNTSKGAGKFSYAVDGGTSIDIISSSKFNTAGWYGSWSTTYVPIVKNVNIVIDSSIVFTVEATENSLYVESYVIRWESYSIETEAEEFATEVMSGVGLNAEDNCAIVLSSLEDLYDSMTEDAKNYFDSSNDTLYVNARARMAYLNSWVLANNPSNPTSVAVNPVTNNLVAIVSIGVLGLTSILGYYLISKKKF
jgi:uncharacterized protein YjdB